jgi:glycosyltransferase involved in cell wall biosynthesis
MVKKRLLVLTPRLPYPTVGGDRVRILHLCRALSSQFELTLLSLCATRGEMHTTIDDGLFSTIERVYLPRWRSYLSTALSLPTSRPLQLAYYESAEFRSRVNSLLPEHDLVLAHLVRTGQYVENWPGPKVLEMTDAISMSYMRDRVLPGTYNWKKMIYRVEQHRLMTYERSTLRRFDRVWLTSSVDRKFLDPFNRGAIDVIPNGADLETLTFRPPARDANVIVFVANMASLQNQDACHYFIRHILPAVKAKANIVFRIVGNCPDVVQKKFMKYPGVLMTGRIERIQDGVAGAFCGVCPVRGGAGIQNKILEYFAMGLPCVSSIAGLSGVDAQPGRDLLAYRDPDEAARQILLLYSDPALRIKMAVAANALVRRKYDWNTAYKALLDSCSRIDLAQPLVGETCELPVSRFAPHRGRTKDQIYSSGLPGIVE